MVKGIKKMNLWIMKPNEFTQTDYYAACEQLINQEAYEEYIILENNQYELQVLGKPKQQEMIGLAKYRSRFYIFNLKGTIDLMKLPELYENISTQDTTAINGFNMVLNMIKEDEENRAYWEKRNRERAEKKRKEEAAEKIKADSLKAINQQVDSLQLEGSNIP